MIYIRLLFLSSSDVVVWIDGDFFGSYPLSQQPWSNADARLATGDSTALIELLDIIEY